MYCKVCVEDIASEETAPEIAHAYAAWQRLADAGGLPSLADVVPIATPDSDDGWMVLRQDGDEFAYEHFGHTLVETFGVDMQGRSTRDLDLRIRTALNPVYRRALETARPALAIHRASYARDVHLWHRLILPVLDADGARRLAVLWRPQQIVHDLLQELLDATPVGIVTLSALRDPDDRIVDAVVISINPKAEDFTGCPASQTIGRRLLELFPNLVTNRTWARYVAVIETGEPLQYDYFDRRSSRWFDVKASPLGDGFMLVFVETTETRQALRALEHEKRQLEQARADLAIEVRARTIAEAELRRIAQLDELTGALNRRGFDRAATEAAHAAVAAGSDLAVIAVDIDNFKDINDGHGHAGGDAVLRMIGRALVDGARSAGRLGRVGGEEFMLLLPHHDIADAVRIAERLREAIATTPVQHEGLTMVVTASFGVQDLARAGSVQAMMLEADRALYRAKDTGRNRVQAYGLDVDTGRDVGWKPDSMADWELEFVE